MLNPCTHSPLDQGLIVRIHIRLPPLPIHTRAQNRMPMTAVCLEHLTRVHLRLLTVLAIHSARLFHRLQRHRYHLSRLRRRRLLLLPPRSLQRRLLRPVHFLQ